MILSDRHIKYLGIVEPCEERGKQSGMSYGLSCAGYDVRANLNEPTVIYSGAGALIPTREQFKMPNDIVGMVRDKSTWARQGVLVNQGVLEPGWVGYLTVWLFNSGRKSVVVNPGDPIAQVVFHQMLAAPSACYTGKYQGQGPGPQGPRFEE